MGKLELSLLVCDPMGKEPERPSLCQKISRVPSYAAKRGCRNEMVQNTWQRAGLWCCHRQLVSTLIALDDHPPFLLRPHDVSVPGLPESWESKSSDEFDCVRIESQETRNGHGGHVPLQNLVKDSWVLEVLNEIIETDKNASGHDREEDGIRSL